jgi:hypothetical protein
MIHHRWVFTTDNTDYTDEYFPDNPNNNNYTDSSCGCLAPTLDGLRDS